MATLVTIKMYKGSEEIVVNAEDKAGQARWRERGYDTRAAISSREDSEAAKKAAAEKSAAEQKAADEAAKAEAAKKAAADKKKA